jgi:hypothetical protein
MAISVQTVADVSPSAHPEPQVLVTPVSIDLWFTLLSGQEDGMPTSLANFVHSSSRLPTSSQDFLQLASRLLFTLSYPTPLWRLFLYAHTRSELVV